MNLLAIKIGAGLALLIAIFTSGHHFGAKGVQAAWAAEKLKHAEQDKAAIIDAITKRDEQHAKDKRLTNEVLSNYANKIAEQDKTITAERAVADRERLRFTRAAPRCPATAGQAASTLIADGAGASEEVELPAAIAEGLRDLAEDADRTVARCHAKLFGLQDWVTSHGFYGPR